MKRTTVNSARFTRVIIESMRKTQSTFFQRLDMDCWYYKKWFTHCMCAGGSVVIHAMHDGTPVSCCEWSLKDLLIADWCDALRRGDFDKCDSFGAPVPGEVARHYSIAMADEKDESFWCAWEAFAEAWEEYEAKTAQIVTDTHKYWGQWETLKQALMRHEAERMMEEAFPNKELTSI